VVTGFPYHVPTKRVPITKRRIMMVKKEIAEIKKTLRPESNETAAPRLPAAARNPCPTVLLRRSCQTAHTRNTRNIHFPIQLTASLCLLSGCTVRAYAQVAHILQIHCPDVGYHGATGSVKMIMPTSCGHIHRPVPMPGVRTPGAGTVTLSELVCHFCRLI